MKRLSFALVAFVLASGAAYATPGNNGGGNGPCGVGQQTNGCGGQGGAGGAGGTGTGVGVGVGVGIAGAASNASATGGTGVGIGGSASVNSSNRNENTQGQQQGQAQSSRNDNRSAATGGSAAATSGGNALTGGAVDVKVNGDTYVEAKQERAPVATAYAAPLTASNGTCMGSTSAGAQAAGWGASFGSTWTDDGCDARYDAQALVAAGLKEAAAARLCQRPNIAKAMEAAGTPCPNKGAKAAAVTTVTPVVAGSGDAIDKLDLQGQRYPDPIVRKRMGLPPL